jgi:hypothetical protein
MLSGSLAYLGYALTLQGEFDRARAWFRECVDMTRGRQDSINVVRYLLGFAHPLRTIKQFADVALARTGSLQ